MALSFYLTTVATARLVLAAGAARSAVVDQSSSAAADTVEVIQVQGAATDDPNLVPVPDYAIDLQERSLRIETLGDVISEVPGASLFRQGGLGASQFVSIRGADFDQTTLLIDDVPLAGPDRGAIDLSLLPLDGFSRIEIFRGSAPIRYGGGTIGGVIRLEPKVATQNAYSLRSAVGSFETLDARTELETSQGDVSLIAAGGALRSENDFRYLNDNATFAVESDDEVARRRNAGIDQRNGFLSTSWEDGGHRIALVGLVVQHDRGLPGPATVVSEDSHQRRTQVFGSIGYRHRGEAARIPVDAFATLALGLDRDRVQDPFGRIGLGREDTRDRFLSLSARTGGFFDLLPGWTIGATTSYRHDDIQPNNRFSTPGDQPSSRELFVAATESHLKIQLDELALSLRTSLAAQFSSARLTESQFQDTQVTEVSDINPNTRLEIQAEYGALSFSSKLSSGSKLPTTLQLFGNRNTVTANTELTAEESLTVDAGFSYSPDFTYGALHAEASVFWLEVSDLIVARRTSQNTVAFANEQSGRSRGFEGAAQIQIGTQLTSSTALTLLDATFDNAGFEREQPLRVPVRVFQRLGLRPIEALETFAEVDHRSGFYADAANLVEQSSFTSFNAGLQATSARHRLTAAVSVRNLFNELGLDLLAFPRPGRAVELSIEWKDSL